MPNLQSERTLDLINRSIDGDLSVEEERELERSASAEPEVALLLGEFRDLDRLLASVPQEEPAPGLKAAVLASLPSPERRSSRSLVSETLARLSTWIQPQPRYVLAWAASLAALVSIAVLLTIGGPDVDPAHAVGSLTDAGGVSESETDLSTLLTSATGSVRGSQATLTLHLAGPLDGHLQIRFDERRLTFVGLHSPSDLTGQEPAVLQGQGSLELAIESSGIYEVLFSADGMPEAAQVSLMRDGQPVVSHLVTWQPLP